MYFLHLIFSFLIATKPLFCADAPAVTNPYEHTISLSKIIAPFALIRMNQNGIAIPKLVGITYWDAHDQEYLVNDYTYTSSRKISITNKPRKEVWVSDPHKKDCMPILWHPATKSSLYIKCKLNNPVHRAVNYQVKSYLSTGESLVKINCMVFPDASTSYQGTILCSSPFDLTYRLDNPLFENLQIFTLSAQRLVGKNPLSILCDYLPQLLHLDICNTELDDTGLTFMHSKLARCKIENCGITKVGSIIAPKLLFLSLASNKLTQFDIHTLDLQPCSIDLRNNNIARVYAKEYKSELPASYLDLRGNPLDQHATYEALFKEAVPVSLSKKQKPKRSFMLLRHDDFAFQCNGAVEDYKKPETKQI
jgi:hypothetical protein